MPRSAVKLHRAFATDLEVGSQFAGAPSAVSQNAAGSNFVASVAGLNWTTAGASGASAADLFRPHDTIKRLVIEPIEPVVDFGASATMSAAATGAADHFVSTLRSAASADAQLQQRADNQPVIVEPAEPPKLSRAGYSMRPDAEALGQMTAEQLSAVSGFSVGHECVGRIEWFAPVDLRGADLDAIVQIDKGSAAVYADDACKPALGQGLNQPALVTLLGCFPRSKKPEAVERFIQKIKALTQEMGAEYVSYERDEGKWVFRVDHW